MYIKNEAGKNKSVDFFNQFFKAIFSQIFHRFQIEIEKNMEDCNASM